MEKVKFITALLIDDDPVDNLIHTKIVQKSTFAESIIVQNSAVSALQMLKDKITHTQLLPEIILLDINMPEMNGFEFLDEFEKISAGSINIPEIIILSSSLNPSDNIRAMRNKLVKGFLIKPLSQDKLLSLF